LLPWILVVEDDHTLRGLLTDVLQLSGRFRAVGVGSIHEAEKCLAKSVPEFSAVVLDPTLPDGDGWEFLSALNRRGFRNPVVILTGLTGDEPERLSSEHGASAHVTKPVSISKLMSLLEAVIHGARADTQLGDHAGEPRPAGRPHQNRSV